MISGFLDVSLSPKTNMIYLWRHQDTQNNPRKIPTYFHIIIWGDVIFGFFEKFGNMCPAYMEMSELLLGTLKLEAL